MPKFHIGVEIKTRSASANRIAMRSSSAKASRWASLNARPLRRAYLASSASPSNSGNLSHQMSITSMSQLGRASRNRATNASAPAEDSEAARGEQRRWNSLGTPSLSSRHPARSPDRPDHRIRVGDDSDVLHLVVDRGIVPLGVHGRTAILGHNDKIALVGAGARGVLDRHVGPGAGIDQHVAAGRLQDGFQPGAFPRAHPHLLDDEIARTTLEPGHRRSTPGAAHQRLGIDDAPEQWRVQRQARRAALDDEPDMDRDEPPRA